MLEIKEVAFGSADFDACMAIRMNVFVAEQNVPAEEERDRHESSARHFLATLNDEAAGTARVIFPAGRDYAKITRVAVLAAYRGHGIGAALMQHVLATIPASQITLDAQVHARRFYEKLGFAPQSGIFMEAGIAHLTMGKTN
jgi:predicted GNAT family N-acyltransferase